MAFNGASADIRRPVETAREEMQDYRSIDAARLLSGLIESDQSLAFCLRMIFSENQFPPRISSPEQAFRDHPLEPRDLELALLGDALESFTGALDAILIIGAV